MAEMSCDNAIEWLSGKGGESVYVEIDAVTAPLAMHVTLSGIESASETDKDRLMVLIRLPELQRSRFYLDGSTFATVCCLRRRRLRSHCQANRPPDSRRRRWAHVRGRVSGTGASYRCATEPFPGLVASRSATGAGTDMAFSVIAGTGASGLSSPGLAS
jgi:hypothetical protein